MNFKQKIAYMAIGRSIHISGLHLRNSGGRGFNPQNVSAQDNTKQVIDEIVCRKIKVVNAKGKTVAILEDSGVVGGGNLSIYNGAGKRVIYTGAQVLFGNGFLDIYNKAGQEVVTANALFDGSGSLAIYNSEENIFFVVEINENKEGLVSFIGKNGEIQLSKGFMSFFNKTGANVLQAGIGNKSGGILVTRDKFGNEIGHLPR